MCLHTILTRQNVGLGYKIFYLEDNNLCSVWFRCPCKVNKWLHDAPNKSKICSIQGSTYKHGFHLFLNPTDCKHFVKIVCVEKYNRKNFTIRRVLYTNVVAIGQQMDMDVVVAQSIKILPGNINV